MNQKNENQTEHKNKATKSFLTKMMIPFNKLIERLIKTKNRTIEKIKNFMKSRFRKIVVGVSIILFLMLLSPWAPSVVPDNSEFPGTNSDDIICWINYPGAVTVMDERMIELTLTNNLETCIPKVKAFLVFSEKLPIVITSPNGSSVADFGCLKAKETKTKRIKFYLKHSNDKSEFSFKLRVMCNNKEEIKKNDPFPIIIVPFFGYLKTLSIPLLSALTLIFIAILTEKLKFTFIEKK